MNFHVGFLREDGEADPDTPIDAIVRHIDYFVDHIGIEHVALGSDFDGAAMPRDLADVAGLPKPIDRLQAAGYGDDDGASHLSELDARVGADVEVTL